MNFIYTISTTSSIWITLIFIFILVGCENKPTGKLDQKRSSISFSTSILDQSESMLGEALQDVYSQSYHFSTVSDSFVLTNTDTLLTVAIPEKARNFLRNWRPVKGVYKGLNSEIELHRGCSATLGFLSFDSTFDTISVFVFHREPTKDTTRFDVTNPCDAWLRNGYGGLPRFVYKNEKYVRLD